jgi:CheY-like chemotaxis protein/HPt (histidine-containing phosphotransfer) domain-containing protein
VTVVSDGLRAIEEWKKDHYDLVFMDVQMPKMDGLEATRVIRRLDRERGGHTPIIALTAAAMKEDVEACHQAGMDGHVAKPIQPEALHRAVETVFAREKMARSKSPRHSAPRGKSDMVIDTDYARQRISDDMSVGELATLMLKECPYLMSEIEAGLEDKDEKRMQRSAHSLISSAGLFNARDVLACAQRLQIHLRDEGIAGSQKLVAELHVRVERFTAALRKTLT